MKKILIFLFSVSIVFSMDLRLEKALKLSKNPVTQEKAAEKLLELTLEGNKRAMTELGRLYIYGKGVPKDCKKGTYLLFGALLKTDSGEPEPEAMKELALMFKRGVCVKKDKEKYQKYLKKYFKMKSVKNKKTN